MGTTDPEQRKALFQRMAELDLKASAACDSYAKSTHFNPALATRNFENLIQAQNRYLPVLKQFVTLIQSGGPADVQAQLQQQLISHHDAFIRACDALIEYDSQTGVTISSRLMEGIAKLRWVVVAVIGLAVLAGLSLRSSLAARQRMEQVLRESEKRFSVAFQYSPSMASISRRRDGRIIAVNDAYQRVFGLLDRNPVGKTFLEIGVWSSEGERAKMLEVLDRDGFVRDLVTEHVIPGKGKITALLSASPVTLEGEECIIATTQDITERKAHEREIERLSRLYLVLSRVNVTLVRASSQADVFQSVCRTLVEDGRFQLAWIGWLNPVNRLLESVAVAGDVHHYVSDIRISADPDVPEGRGPSGVAFRESRIYVCNDFFSDPVTAPWRERAARSGIHASMALPLRLNAQTMGLLTVYAGEKDFFQAREIELLQETADDISFALDVFADRERRQQAERALRQSEEQLRSTMTSSAIGMAIIAPDHRVIEVNPALCRLLGYSREELLAKSLQAVTHPDDRAAGPWNFRRVLAGEIDSYVREKRYVHKDGHLIWAQLTVSLVRDDNGQPVHFVGQVQDVTERKHTLSQLAELTEHLGLALKIAQLGVWQYWFETQKTTWDVRTYEMFGFDKGAEPPPFEKFVQRIHSEDRNAYREAWLALLKTGEGLRIRFRVVTPDGRCRNVETHALMHRDTAGGPPWILGVNIDLTEVVTATTNAERYHTQLMQAQKMETLGQLAGGVAHDFNNLLTGINGFVELAEMTLPPGHEGIRMLNHAKRAAANARDLVRRILVFSRQAPARTREPVRLGDIVRDTAPLVSTLLPPSITLTLELDAATPQVLADAGQIQQVIMNLCTNAGHAIGRTVGTVKISVDTCAPVETTPGPADAEPGAVRRVRLRVSDSGCGMDAETVKRIFEPFFTTKKAGEGTGLGLSIVQSIVQEHGGTVAIESEVGQGTTFSLLFPSCDGPVALNGAGEAQVPAVQGDAVILVIDDEPTIVTLATAILSRAGYTVVPCASPNEAWRTFAADAERFDLVLTDYAMPEMSGIEFMMRAHALVPELRFVIMSANPTQIPTDWQQQVCVVQKPFENVELLQAIRKELRSG